MPPVTRRRAAKHNPYGSIDEIQVSHTISAEAANARTVSFQFKDANGVDLAVPIAVRGYMSGADGMSFAAAPAGGIVAGADGMLIEAVDNRYFTAVTEADGDLDIVLTDASGAITHHMTIILPNGKLYFVTPIAFT